MLIKKSSDIFEFLKELRIQNIPEDQYRHYLINYLQLKARERAIPLHGSFELTPLCNLDCKMCYVHLKDYQYRQDKLISADTWKGIMKDAFDAGMRRASLTGGECLTYPEFDTLYLYLFNLGIAPSVLTNGTLIDDKRIAFFKKYPPRLIQITLYGSSNDAYENVTGRRAFDTVYNNLISIRDSGLPLHITITPSIYMQNDIEHLLEKANDLKVPYYINSCLKPPREYTGRIAEDLSIDQYIKLYTLSNRLQNIETNPIDISKLPQENKIGVKRYGLRCGAGRSAFAIMHDGNMCPCFSLRNIVSNTLEVGFKAAWKKINESATSYPIPEECNDCIYYNSCLSCPAIHLNAPDFGHCDPRICERTKKLISAGVAAYPIDIKE